MTTVLRPAAVAGRFYPGEAVGLGGEVARLLATARARGQSVGARPPKILVVPHAGYAYSGVSAAIGYVQLEPARRRIRRVVMLGPAHRMRVRGIALSEADAFCTPLGRVPVDAVARRALLERCPQVTLNEPAHAWEHALEVQLPFLQTVLDEFAIVPLLVGQASADQVACAIETLWGGDETLILVSSDLSHYHEDAVARSIDRHTVEQILSLNPSIEAEQACGALAIDAAILCAMRHGLAPRLLDLRNSGDASGDRRQVVGYCAIAFDACDDDAG